MARSKRVGWRTRRKQAIGEQSRIGKTGWKRIRELNDYDDKAEEKDRTPECSALSERERKKKKRTDMYTSDDDCPLAAGIEQENEMESVLGPGSHVLIQADDEGMAVQHHFRDGVLRLSIELGYHAVQTKAGKTKAVGHGEHLGKTLYGKQAERALAGPQIDKKAAGRKISGIKGGNTRRNKQTGGGTKQVIRGGDVANIGAGTKEVSGVNTGRKERTGQGPGSQALNVPSGANEQKGSGAPSVKTKGRQAQAASKEVAEKTRGNSAGIPNAPDEKAGGKRLPVSRKDMPKKPPAPKKPTPRQLSAQAGMAADQPKPKGKQYKFGKGKNKDTIYGPNNSFHSTEGMSPKQKKMYHEHLNKYGPGDFSEESKKSNEAIIKQGEEDRAAATKKAEKKKSGGKIRGADKVPAKEKAGIKKRFKEDASGKEIGKAAKASKKEKSLDEKIAPYGKFGKKKGKDKLGEAVKEAHKRTAKNTKTKGIKEAGKVPPVPKSGKKSPADIKKAQAKERKRAAGVKLARGKKK